MKVKPLFEGTGEARMPEGPALSNLLPHEVCGNVTFHPAGRRLSAFLHPLLIKNSTLMPGSVAILGAGPAACTLAALLASRGVPVAVFDDGKRPEMLVGESLIPAVVPLLRRLGLEERTAAISQHKPGVSFLHPQAPSIHFNFSPVAPRLPTYAYNVDRLPFDALLKTRAAELGARFIPLRAGLVRHAPGALTELSLDPAAQDALHAGAPEFRGQAPRLLVDATGRSRLFARLLRIGAERGPRDDLSHFAHYQDFGMPSPAGQVLITRLTHGWSWRIPLPGRKMSFGIVLGKEAARAAGATAEERLAHCLAHEPLLEEAGRHARRISPCGSYANYQLTSHRSHGAGWAAIGDAFGFVDPMLSSGLFLAMESAAQLDAALASGRSLRPYDATMRRWYRDWTRLIRYFYDGRIFSLYEAGHLMRQNRPHPVQQQIDRLLNRHIACMTAGALTKSRRSQFILGSAARLLIRGVTPPAQLAIQ